MDPIEQQIIDAGGELVPEREFEPEYMQIQEEAEGELHPIINSSIKFDKDPELMSPEETLLAAGGEIVDYNKQVPRPIIGDIDASMKKEREEREQKEWDSFSPEKQKQQIDRAKTLKTFSDEHMVIDGAIPKDHPDRPALEADCRSGSLTMSPLNELPICVLRSPRLASLSPTVRKPGRPFAALTKL